MDVTIQLDRTVFFPGDTVRGQVRVSALKEEKARKIIIKFVGMEHAVVTRGSGKHRRVYIENNIIVQDESLLWMPTGNQTFGPKDEVFPFEFFIPEGALPSVYTPLQYSLSSSAIQKGITRQLGFKFQGEIMYTLKAFVDKPLAIDPKHIVRLDVIDRPIPSRTNYNIMCEHITPNGEIHVKLVTRGDTFLPGERVQGTAFLQVNPQVNVRSISVMLSFYYRKTARGHTDRYRQKVDWVEIKDPMVGSAIFTTDFNLELLPDGPFTVLGKLVSIEWEADVKVDLPFKIDKHVRIPLKIVREIQSETIAGTTATEVPIGCSNEESEFSIPEGDDDLSPEELTGIMDHLEAVMYNTEKQKEHEESLLKHEEDE